MNTIGMPRSRCARALEAYVERLRELTALLSSGEASRSEAHARLEDLRFQLEVDVRARASAEGRARMTAVEAISFEPALRAAWTRIAEIEDAGNASAITQSLQDVASRLSAWRDCIETCSLGSAHGCAKAGIAPPSADA